MIYRLTAKLTKMNKIAHMSHFVKSSKSELMFAALALPRGWKNQVEHWNLLLSHFGLSSRSEWIDNCLQLLDVSEKYHWLSRKQERWSRDKCQGLLTRL